MPVTAIPEDFLAKKLSAMQRQLDELTRAVGRPTDQVRDANDNVIHMVPGAAYPVIGARGQDVSLSMADGVATVTDENGRYPRPIAAQQFNGPVSGDTTGVHHGDVGVNGAESYNHYGDLHGNSYGFHYGAVGDGSTQNQVNATNVFATAVHSNTFGFHYGPVGDGITQNQINCLKIFHTGAYGDVGDPGAFYQLYGTVHAPSERGLKVGEQPLQAEGGAIVDAVPSATWRWDPLVRHDDGHVHAGPMVDDIAEVAPWMVRPPGDADGARSLADRDLIGVLWAALRDARQRINDLEQRQAVLGGAQ